MDSHIDETRHVIVSDKSEKNKRYKDQIIQAITSATCAMLNTNGGKVVILSASDSNDTPAGGSSSSQMSSLIRIVEQSMISIIGLHETSSNINFKGDNESMVILVRKADSLITNNYNLYLPSQSQVVLVSPLERPEKVKEIINRKVILEPVQIGSHNKIFRKDSTCDIHKSKTVQLKHLKAYATKWTVADHVISKSSKFTCYVSAFANYMGGHIYYGNTDEGVVVGQLIQNEEDQSTIAKKVEGAIKKMIWPAQIRQPKRGEHWDIFFEAVVDEDNKPIPSTFVIVIFIAACAGGVFTKEPECYEMVEKQVEKMSFITWKKRMLLPEIPEFWKWIKTSKVHREKLMKLQEYGRNHPEKIKEVNGVRVCCSEDFLIAPGADGTRVYVGLGKDGCEKAVKRLPRDICRGLAENEKEILVKVKSSNVVRYWFLSDKKCDKEYLFLILDLCEETLHDFVSQHKSKEDLAKIAPDITRQVLEGLDDLHRGETAILHRDLKPKNILRNVDGKWLLADFGISRFLRGNVTTHLSIQRGTKHWRAVESCITNVASDNGQVRYKKESDIQVAGMVAFYILTKGEHPFGEEPDRERNLLDGNPVYLDKLEDPAAKDLISWMLSYDPKKRPSAMEALKHPYIQPKKRQFEMLCKMGNQPEIKKEDNSASVVVELNRDSKDWKTFMEPDVLNYLCTGVVSGKLKTFPYGSSWTECLRLIRNVDQHKNDRPSPLPKPVAFGDPQEYFLKKFPNLPVVVHRIVRQCDWKQRAELQEYFS